MASTNAKNAIKRLTGILRDVVFVANGDEATSQNSLISLEANAVYEIVTAEKNGSAMTQGQDYDWTKPRGNVEITGESFNLNDVFYFTIQRRLSDAVVDNHIEKAERTVKSKLAPAYDPADLDLTIPTLENIVIMLAVGRIRQLLGEGVALESAWYRSGRDLEQQALEALREIRKGRQNIVKADDTEVGRLSHALVGGFTTGTTIDSRKAWREQQVDWDRFALNFYPFDDTVDDSE